MDGYIRQIDRFSEPKQGNGKQEFPRILKEFYDYGIKVVINSDYPENLSKNTLMTQK